MPAFIPSWKVLITPFQKYASDNIMRHSAGQGLSFRGMLGYLKAYGEAYGEKLTYGRKLEQQTYGLFQERVAKMDAFMDKPLDFVPTSQEIMKGRYWQPEPFKTVVRVNMVNTDTQEVFAHNITYYSEKPRSLADIPVESILDQTPDKWGPEWTVGETEIATVEARSDI